MAMHPLKFITLFSISALIIDQLSLALLLTTDYRFMLSVALTLPLLIPLKGLWQNRIYTYKWSGFLTLLYFSIGISESFAHPAIRFYSAVNVIGSGLLFVGCIYYTRYLKMLRARTHS